MTTESTPAPARLVSKPSTEWPAEWGDIERLLYVLWDDPEMLAWTVAEDGVRFWAVWTDDDDVARRAPVSPANVPELLALADEERAAGAYSPWEFVEEYVDLHLNDPDPTAGQGVEHVPFEVDDFLRRAFEATSDDDLDVGWFARKEPGVRLWVGCSDFFAWGCADAEEVTPENIEVLEAARVECAALGQPSWAGRLFAARVRGIRPQGAYYAHIPDELTELFDACGPERTPGFGDPRSREQGISRRKDDRGDVDVKSVLILSALQIVAILTAVAVTGMVRGA